MNLSVIIPTKNRASELIKCVGAVLSQTNLPEELIIVDQSILSQEEMLRNNFDWERTKLIFIWDKNLSGLTEARNLGIERASGDIVLFLDDDVILEPRYIAAILDVYNKDSTKKIGGVGGLITNFKFSNFWASFSRIICHGPWKNHYNFWYQNGSGVLPTHFLSGCNMSYRKEVLTRFRFDERLNGICMGEDQMFSYQVSRYYKLFMTAEARLKHLVSQISRQKERKLRAMSVFSNYYFFKHHVEKNFYNIIYYLVNTFGTAVIALLSGNKERIFGTYIALAKLIFGKSPLK
jgi:GT2 family glycosyltransferase